MSNLFKFLPSLLFGCETMTTIRQTYDIYLQIFQTSRLKNQMSYKCIKSAHSDTVSEIGYLCLYPPPTTQEIPIDSVMIDLMKKHKK